jgi:hypothetical protein
MALEIFRLSFLFLFPFLEGMKDGNTLSKDAKKYHRWGWLIRAGVAGVCVPAWYFLPLVASYFWIIFDLTRNVEAGDPPMYVGHTSWLDLKLGKSIYSGQSWPF